MRTVEAVLYKEASLLPDPYCTYEITPCFDVKYSPKQERAVFAGVAQLVEH